MARRMKSKIQPAAQTFTFQFNAGDPQAGDFKYIDLSQVASLVNRRFYRQGINWAVSGFKLSTGTGVDGKISINKLPNTWVMSNAWEKGFRAWQQMIKNATDMSGTESVKGKFLDFKVLANEKHFDTKITAGTENLMPTSAYTTTFHPATPGQWQYSEITIPNTTATPGAAIDYHLVAVGGKPAGKDFFTLVEGYENSRALPSISDPNTPDEISTVENWMLQLFNDGTQQDTDVMDILEATGDQPPYPFENGVDAAGVAWAETQYPNGQNQMPTLQPHDNNYVTSTTIGGHTYMKGGNFPCGLIELHLESFKQGDSFLLQIDLVPGAHRGYLCEPMTEM